MSHNTWIHRTVRPGVKLLAHTPITPNHLTTVRLLTGVVSAGLFAVGGSLWSYWGAALFLLSMLSDRADGELARISGKSSAWGHTYDLVTDAISGLQAQVEARFRHNHGWVRGVAGTGRLPRGLGGRAPQRGPRRPTSRLSPYPWRGTELRLQAPGRGGFAEETRILPPARFPHQNAPRSRSTTPPGRLRAGGHAKSRSDGVQDDPGHIR